MKSNLLSAMLLAGAAIVYSCGNSGNGDSTNNDTAGLNANNVEATNPNNGANTSGPVSEADRQFMMNAATADMMEIQAANMAQQNAQHQAVKDYAAMMLRDHTASSSELKPMASANNVMLSDSLPADAKQHMDAMAKMKGKAFDTHYMQMMTTDHSKVISLFESTSQSASNPQVKAFAEKQLPILRMHLDSAKAISQRL
jgi:putative membrane protein